MVGSGFAIGQPSDVKWADLLSHSSGLLTQAYGKMIGGDEMAPRFRKSKKLGKCLTIGIPGRGIYDVEEISPSKPKKANRTCRECNHKAGQKDGFCRYCGVNLQYSPSRLLIAHTPISRREPRASWIPAVSGKSAP